jgi:Citrate transporter
MVRTAIGQAGQAWPPFVLVAGLLLIGVVAAADGLFEAFGARLARTRLGARGLLLALLGLVAAVTAVLNLDTSVVFLTPVLIHAGRRRRLDERPFLYRRAGTPESRRPQRCRRSDTLRGRSATEPDSALPVAGRAWPVPAFRNDA